MDIKDYVVFLVISDGLCLRTNPGRDMIFFKKKYENLLWFGVMPYISVAQRKKTAKENDVMLAFYQATCNVLHISVSKFCTKQLNVKKSLLKDFTTAEQHIYFFYISVFTCHQN